MKFKKLPSNSKKLLDDIINVDNPTDMLSKSFDGLSAKEDEELRAIIRELREAGYISVNWADNKPFRVTVSNSARNYDNLLKEYEREHQVIVDQSIRIGDNNTIKASAIGSKIGEKSDVQPPSKGFAEKHPILLSIIISLVTGFLLLFSFWENIINWIEGLF